MRNPLLPAFATVVVLASAASLFAVENPKPTTKPTTNPLAQINDDLLKRHLMESRGAEDEATRAARRIDACMARASERLARENDPGQTTQQIQDQIIKDIDELIELARKPGDPPPPSTKPSTKPSDGVPNPTESIGIKPENQGEKGEKINQKQPGPPKIGTGGHNSASYSAKVVGTGDSGTSGDIRQDAEGWGRIPGRIRADIIQSIGDDIIEKYHKLTADYYRAIATKATERQ